MFVYQGGIRIFGTPLWLDAKSRVDLSFISHAHTDHIRGHRQILASEKTIRLFQHRLRSVEAISLKFDHPIEVGPARVEIFPSGHILGASQIRVEKDDQSLVYTGDFKLRPSLTAEPIVVKKADILIMETTFGHPRYRFPDPREVIGRMVEFVDSCLKRGFVPIILAYSLGKGQEVMKILGELGYRLSVHPSIADLARIYEQFGVAFRNWQRYEGGDLEGRVLVVPPRFGRSPQVEAIPRKKKLILTGWAVDPDARRRYGVDLALPLSDHADFDELIQYVRMVAPRKVYTTHGFEEFCYFLHRLGFRAEPLRSSPQLSLF